MPGINSRTSNEAAINEAVNNNLGDLARRSVSTPGVTWDDRVVGDTGETEGEPAPMQEPSVYTPVSQTLPVFNGIVSEPESAQRQPEINLEAQRRSVPIRPQAAAAPRGLGEKQTAVSQTISGGRPDISSLVPKAAPSYPSNQNFNVVAASPNIEETPDQSNDNQASSTRNESRARFETVEPSGYQDDDADNDDENGTVQQSSPSPEEKYAENRRYYENNRMGIDNLAGRATDDKSVKTTWRLTALNRRFSEAKKSVRKRVKRKLGNKTYRGTSFYETIFVNRNIMPHEVTIGTENLMEAIRSGTGSLLKIINDKRKDLGLDPISQEDCLNDISKLKDTLNNDINLEVVLDKSPVNKRSSIQVRTVRVHDGRGIGLHPTQTKGYNADFDGDPATINFDQNQIGRYGKAMAFLIDIDGNPLIDPDFFPIDFIGDNENQKNEIKELIGEKINWDHKLANKIANTYIDLCNDPSRESWRTFLKSIEKNSSSNFEMSRVLKSIYDFSVERRMGSIASNWAKIEENSLNKYEAPQSNDPFIIELLDLVDYMVAGRSAVNTMEVTKLFNKYYGDLPVEPGEENKPRKNVPFRLLADFAKAANRTDLITIGNDMFGIMPRNGDTETPITITDFCQYLSATAYTKLIKGNVNYSHREFVKSDALKINVMRELSEKYGPGGVPVWNRPDQDDKELYKEWLGDFIRIYNYHNRIIKNSGFVFLGGMFVNRGKDIKFYDGIDIANNYNGLARAIVEIYGNKTVERMFPNIIGEGQTYGYKDSTKTIAHYYRNMTLDEFVRKNRLYFSNEGKATKFEAIEKRMSRGAIDPLDILILVANRRQVQYVRYGDSWNKATLNAFEIIKFLKNFDRYDIDSFEEYAPSLAELVYLVGPDMYDFYGMDSPATFFASKYGRMIHDCETVDDYRNIYLEMYLDYRMNSLSMISSEIADSNNGPYGDFGWHSDRFLRRLEENQTAYELELDSLASSSLVWETIIRETTSENSIWNQLIKNKGNVGKLGSSMKNLKFESDKVFKSNQKYLVKIPVNWRESNGILFKPAFNGKSIASKYDNLLDFLHGDSPFDIKISVLTDIVRISQGMFDIKTNEMMGQLVCQPDRYHSGYLFDTDARGISDEIKTVKASIDRMSDWETKTPIEINKKAANIFKKMKLGTPKGSSMFERKLQRMADEPGYLCYIPSEIISDAIASVYDKTYSDSEKGKQSPLVNALFEALSYQRCGGFYTHLQQTDNAVVNVIGYDQITAMDVINILAHPEIELHIYDEFGRPATISRSNLCGDDSTDSLMKWLKENPKVLIALERTVIGVDSDVNGTARVKRNILSNAEVSDAGKVLSLLNDRPRFLAIAALCTPSDNVPGRVMSQRINDTLNDICNFVIELSSSNEQGDIREKKIVEFLGLENVDSLKRERMIVTAQDRNDDIAYYFDVDDEQFGQGIKMLVSDVVSEINTCADLVHDMYPNLSIRKDFDSSNKLSVDESSVISYYDVRQQLSGSRTWKMIQIEGAETKKNLIIKEFLKRRKDTYMQVDREFSLYVLDKIEKSLGIQSGELDRRLDDGETVVIPVPENWVVEDETLEWAPTRQLGSICKFLEIKRENGAETYNMKAKKFGDDGKNSIVKFLKMATRSTGRGYGYDVGDRESFWTIEDASELREEISNCDTKEEAVKKLATALFYADLRLGYTDDGVINLADYYNRADLMIAIDSDSANVEAGQTGKPVFVIRTLEQLSTAMRSRLSDEAISSKSEFTIIAELQDIADVLGTSNDPMLIRDDHVVKSCLNKIKGYSSTSKSTRVNRAVLPHSSSTERNYSLMYQLQEEYAKEYGRKMPSRKKIEHTTKLMLTTLKSTNSRLSENIKDMILFSTESSDIGYDYVGRPQDYSGNKLIANPGPTNLVLIDDQTPESSVQPTIEFCEKFGNTVMFSSYDLVPDEYKDDAMDMGRGIWMLPFFDMMLNGSASKPISGAPGMHPFQPNQMVVSVEDTTYEFGEGDATAHGTQELIDKAHVSFGGYEVFTAEQLFPTLLQNYKNSDFSLDYCTNDEIVRFILSDRFDPETLGIKGFEGQIVDIGIPKGSKEYNDQLRRFKIRYEEYKNNFSTADDESMLTGEVGYDSIVTFVKIIVDGKIAAFAPIWPFHAKDSGRIPTKFTAEELVLDRGSSSFALRWNWSGSILNQYIKFFEGIGKSNKMIMFGEPVKSRTLQDGTPVDLFYSTKSVSSRFFASNKRINTMTTLMMLPRINPNYSYNFAELDGAFRNHPPVKLENGDEIDIKDAVLNLKLDISDWQYLRDTGQIGRCHDLDDIDSLVRLWIDKCCDFGTVNPNVLLATRSGNGLMWPMYTEFECFLDTNMTFQNALMHFFNLFHPDLVPASMEEADQMIKGNNGITTLFIPVTDDKTDIYGCLQMAVPHYLNNETEPFYARENVYISSGFFSDEFSGFKRVNYNAYNRSIDDLNVANSASNTDLALLMEAGRSEYSSVQNPRARDFEVVPDNIWTNWQGRNNVENNNEML